MEKKRDWVAILLEAVCWIALMGADFFFILSFIPRKFFWVFLVMTLLILLYALGRRKLWRKKVFLRISGFFLALVSLVTCWVCFSESSQAFESLWDLWEGTEDLSYYDELKGGSFSTSENERDIFPYPIPEYASEIKFHYSPQVLQGGRVLSLSFCAPQEEVGKWEAFFKEKADYPGSYLDQGLTAHDMTISLGFPSEFKTYVIYAQYPLGSDNPPLDGYPWNHGQIYYGAINPVTNRVYFYKSSW